MPSTSGHNIKSRADAESLLIRRLQDLGLRAEPDSVSIRDAIQELVLTDCICAKINGTLYTFGAVYERLYGERVDGTRIKRKA